MQWRKHALLLLLALTVPGMVRAQQSQPSTSTPPAKAPAKKAPAGQPAPKADAAPETNPPQTAEMNADAQLQIAVQEAGNDVAKLVQNLEAYLVRFPDSPRKSAIYRALAQSEMQAHNDKAALDYAEKDIAMQPDDSQTMFLAATILEQMPDDASQIHGIDYDTKLIDFVAKADPESRSPQMTLEDWQASRNKFTMNLYVLRGRMERHLHKNDDAVKDFNHGFRLQPNAEAAVNLGEIAEEQKHADEAIHQYAQAFFLAGLDPDDNDVDRDSLRLRIGNLWHFSHDSDAGLGDILLAAYDKDKTLAIADKPDAPVYNQGVTDPMQFTVRRVDGKDAFKMVDAHGKVVILNFWATWCAYCQTLEPMLADVRKKFAGRDDVISLTVNTDELEAGVGPYLQTQKLEGTLVFADGLAQAYKVTSIPTVIVLDRSGKVAYRAQGYAPDGFVDLLAAAVTKASAAPAQ